MKHSILSIAIISTLSASALADEGFSGEARIGYTNTKDGSSDSVDTLAAGGRLGYKTRSYRGISAGATLYTTHSIGSVDDDFLFLSSAGNGYSILGESYLKASLGKTAIKLGRQEVDTPFADTDDIGMIPNTFEGLVISNTRIKNTTLVAAQLNRWAGVDNPDTPERFTTLNNGKAQALGVAYEMPDKWNAQLWHYRLVDVTADTPTSINYLELGVSPRENLGLSVQYATQNYATDPNARVWGVSAEYGIGKVTLSAAHNEVTSGTVINGFGGGPFFTSSENLTIDGTPEQTATALGVEYAFNKLTVGARQVSFKKR